VSDGASPGVATIARLHAHEDSRHLVDRRQPSHLDRLAQLEFDRYDFSGCNLHPGTSLFDFSL
jgi:hypothetical protein